jgi:hypothetical protein
VSFAAGELASEVALRDDGSKRHQGGYLDGAPEGEWTGWYADGTAKWQARFRAGRRLGKVTRRARPRMPAPPAPPPPPADLAAPPTPVICEPGTTPSGIFDGRVFWCDQDRPATDRVAARLPLLLLPYWNRRPRLPIAIHADDPLADQMRREEDRFARFLLARKHGPWNLLADKLIGEHRDGRPTGLWRFRDFDQPAVDWQFADDEEALRWFATIRFDDGRQLAGWYVDGRREGVWVYRHAGGAKAVEGSFAAGVREGTWSCWRPDGAREAAGEWAEDQPRGGPSCAARLREFE